VAKILVIEDAEEIQDNIKDILAANGYEVVTAGNESEALKLAFNELPDLIVCDLQMERRDSGFRILDLVRKDADFGAKVPFIFLTAAADKDSMRRGMKEGADDYLTKPFTTAELLDAIATRLHRSSVIATAACEIVSPAYIILFSPGLPEEGVRYDIGNFLIIGRNEQCYPRILGDSYTSSFACVVQPRQDEEGKQKKLYSISDGSIGKTRKLAPGEKDPSLSTHGVWINGRRIAAKFATLRGGETIMISPRTRFEFYVARESKKTDDPTIT